MAKAGCAIEVAYEVSGADWKLSVSDNGYGKGSEGLAPARIGLGTSIVQALAGQLDARVETISGHTGTTVSIAHSAIKSVPIAA